MDVHIGLWITFGITVVTALGVDLGLKSHRGAHIVSFKEAAIWTGLWLILGIAFAGLIQANMGNERAFEYLTAYLIEKSLSVDNMFVFILIFKYFNVGAAYQHRVLTWGILGAIVMRFIIIFAGVTLLHYFHWMLYIFGGLLIITALKMFKDNPEAMHPENNHVLKLIRKVIPMTTRFDDYHFFTKIDGKSFGTPLFAALLVVEASDLVFAIDSIPAVLAISRDPFIIFTSNIFAILGLRSLYFLIQGLIGYFRYLRFGLAIVLLFIGAKMLMADIYHVPIGMSLGVIGMILAASILLSVIIKDESVSHEPPKP